MTTRIALLDDLTASRIAAGEVVERPASAVKELVENALDAGATQVDVLLEEGGKRRIEVRDDGCGMDAEDAVLAIQRHATSKIRSADDLFAIKTLGFRGEALPSIASVSHFSLTSKAQTSESGCRLVVRGGVLDSVEEAGCRDGTVIVVEDLFFNTPARLKFLKTTPTELARCLDSLGQLAAAYPGVVLQVHHNRQTLLSTPGTGDLLNALAGVWGRDLARCLVPVDYDDYGLRISGLVGTPEATRPGRSHELFVVNGRPVRSRVLGHALEQAYRDLTPESRYPVACLRLDIAPDMVDVNVHPTKMEVKFTNERDVHAAITRALRATLLGHGMLPQVSLPDEAATGRHDAPHSSVGRPSVQAVQSAIEGFAPAPGDTTSLADQLRDFRVMGQVRSTYIVAVTGDGIAFVDQHVAHERVLYERLTAKRDQHGVVGQRLAVPLTMTFGPSEAALLTQRREDFQRNGWDIEPFGRSSFAVRAVPAMLRGSQHEAVLRDMVDELAHQSVARRLIVDRNQITIAHACRMAVKAGDVLSIEEMTGLLEQLSATVNPYLCPHGRPAVVTVPFTEIDRRFKR